MNRLRGIALLSGAALLLWPALRIKAFNPQPDPPVFGPIGIDPFATARLNAACADGSLPGGVNPGPCDVTLTFRDANGLTLQQMHVTLAPGQAAHLDQRATAGVWRTGGIAAIHTADGARVCSGDGRSVRQLYRPHAGGPEPD